MTIKEIQQDLFNQAYIGLRNQNWQQSISYVGTKTATLNTVINNQMMTDLPLNGRNVREPVCRYRSEVGLKCAVGHCIPDNLYKDIYEGRSFTIPFYDNAVQLTTGDCVKPGEYCRAERLILDEFISYMQAAHDSNEAPTEMQKAMNLIADTYKLEIPA